MSRWLEWLAEAQPDMFIELSEELAAENPSAASCVIARAVSALPSLVELASPLLLNGGRLIALKGPLTAEELTAGRAAAGLCGMRFVSEDRYKLPGGENRTVVVFQREGRSRTPLPRRPGMAQRHPLA